MLHIVGHFVTQSPADPHGWLWHQFYDWQTAFAGLGAVGAAFFTIRKTNEQIAVARDQLKADRLAEKERRERRLRALRSALPGVLSLLCEHASSTAKCLNQAWPASANLYPDERRPIGGYGISGVLVPTFPTEFVEPLTSVIEVCDDPKIEDRIGSIFREAQILDARTRDFDKGVMITLDQLAGYILEAVTLYARAESLFPYARRNSEELDYKPLWERVYTALDTLGISRSEVRDKAFGQMELGLPPGEGDSIPTVLAR